MASEFFYKKNLTSFHIRIMYSNVFGKDSARVTFLLICFFVIYHNSIVLPGRFHAFLTGHLSRQVLALSLFWYYIIHLFSKMVYFIFRAEDWSKLSVTGWRNFNHVLGVGILGRVSGSFTHFTSSEVCVSLSTCSLSFHFYLKKLSNFLSSYLAICLDKFHLF